MSTTPHDAINWFEIATLEIERATRFYEALLSITLIPYDTAEPMRLFPSNQKGVGGALVQRQNQPPSPTGTLVYLNVDSGLEAALTRLKALPEGKTLIPITPVPGGFGTYAIIQDSEGNHIGLHQH